MTKQEVEQKIKEIILKDDRFKNANIEIKFKNKTALFENENHSFKNEKEGLHLKCNPLQLMAGNKIEKKLSNGI